jgi:hypothetical protein
MTELETYLARVPAIEVISSGRFDDGNWWVKFRIDVAHALAWRVVQELAFVLNYVSITERLPTVFKPVSPPPYLNGGTDFLSWVIEAEDPAFTPARCAEWLEGRLPRPVEDPETWNADDDRSPPSPA